MVAGRNSGRRNAVRRFAGRRLAGRSLAGRGWEKLLVLIVIGWDWVTRQLASRRVAIFDFFCAAGPQDASGVATRIEFPVGLPVRFGMIRYLGSCAGRSEDAPQEAKPFHDGGQRQQRQAQPKAFAGQHPESLAMDEPGRIDGRNPHRMKGEKISRGVEGREKGYAEPAVGECIKGAMRSRGEDQVRGDARDRSERSSDPARISFRKKTPVTVTPVIKAKSRECVRPRWPNREP